MINLGALYVGLIIGGAVLLLIIIIFVILKCQKKEPKVLIDQKYVENLINLLGSKENIDSIDVDGNKLKVLVFDLNKADLNGLKEVAKSGVFVTGNNIKTLFMYDSKALKEEIKKYKEK